MDARTPNAARQSRLSPLRSKNAFYHDTSWAQVDGPTAETKNPLPSIPSGKTKQAALRALAANVRFVITGSFMVVTVVSILGVALYFSDKTDHKDEAKPTIPRREMLSDYPADDPDFMATIKLMSAWSDNLMDTETADYKHLASHLENLMDLIYDESDVSDAYNYTIVSGLRASDDGKVLAEVYLYLKDNASVSSPQMDAALGQGCSALLLTKRNADITSMQCSFHNVTQNPPPPAWLEVQCGNSSPTTRPSISRMMGEHIATINSHPWLVLLLREGRPICGGSIWDLDHILTAASCVYSMAYYKNGTELVNTSTLQVRANRTGESQTQSRPVLNATIHRDYNNQTFENDIAIVRLSSRLEQGTSLQPIGHPGVDTPLPGSGFVAGWGIVEDPHRFMASAVCLFSPGDCRRHFARSFSTGDINSYLHNDTFCASSVTAGVTCQGDAGGPLVAPANAESSNMVILGVMSATHAAGCAKAGNPSFYTFVPRYLPWISETIKSMYL